MRKSATIFWISVLGMSIALSGCDELFGDLTKFDSDYTYFEFKIYPQENTGEHEFYSKIQESDLTEVLEDNGFDEDNIDEVKLKEAIFEVINSDMTINFDPVGSLKASISATGKGETIIADIDPVPENTREVTLSKKGDDIATFLKETQYTFKAFGTIDEVFTDTIEVSAKIKYEVKGKL